MFASEVFVIGLAVISIGFRPIDGFDLSTLRDDARLLHFRRTPEADSYAEPTPNESRQHWDNDQNPELRGVFEQLFPVTSDVHYRDRNPPQRLPWDSPDDDSADNVDENSDETYRIRKRYYVPAASCDSVPMERDVGPGSHHGNAVSKLMRMPRRIHRRSAEENEDTRRKRTETEDKEKEQRAVRVNDNDLEVTSEDDALESKAFPEPADDSVKQKRADDDDDDDNEIDTAGHRDPEQTDVDQPPAMRSAHFDEQQRELNRIAIQDFAPHTRPHSLSEMLDLQRKLRYEGIHQVASDRRKAGPGNERERSKPQTPPEPTRLSEDAV